MQYRGKNPKVSICIGTYNRIDTLKRLINSIMIQDYKDYEIIICDDSTNLDIQKFASENPLLRYYKNDQQLGAAANINKAMSYAKGEYIKVMHDDDWFTDSKSLEKFVALIDDDNLLFAFSGSNSQNADGSFSPCRISWHDTRMLCKKEGWNAVYRGALIGAPSATIWRNTGFEFDEKLRWFVDLDLYATILRSNPQYRCTSELLVNIGLECGEGDVKNETFYCLEHPEMILNEAIYIVDKHKLKDKYFLVSVLRNTRLPITASGNRVSKVDFIIICIYNNICSFWWRCINYIYRHLVQTMKDK